jgi:hypothetical protein
MEREWLTRLVASLFGDIKYFSEGLMEKHEKMAWMLKAHLDK